MTGTDRATLAEEVVRRLAAALRGAQLYAAGHPLVARSVGALVETLALTLANMPTIWWSATIRFRAPPRRWAS